MHQTPAFHPNHLIPPIMASEFPGAAASRVLADIESSKQQASNDASESHAVSVTADKQGSASIPAMAVCSPKSQASGGSNAMPPVVDDLQSKPSTGGEEPQNQGISLRYAGLVATYPRLCLFGFLCSAFFFAGLLFVSVKAGSKIYFEISPPFYVSGHTSYEREDAVKQALQDADSIPPYFLNESGKIRAARLPRQMTTHELQIIYEVPENENVWDLKHLKVVADIEERILQASGKNSKGELRSYSDYCQLVYKSSTAEILNPGNPCKNPLSPIGFLWSPWMPVAYNSIWPHAKSVNPKLATSLASSGKPAVHCPLPSHRSAANETDAVRSMATSLLPNDFHIDEFLAMASEGRLCEAGKRIASELTCEQFKLCYALLDNTVTMQAWALMNNSMWDYSAIESYHKANIKEFLDYWSTYGALPEGTQGSVNITDAAHQPFVYGTIVQREDDRQVYIQTLPNLIRRVADASFGSPYGGRSGKAVMSTFYFGGPLENIDKDWTSLGGDALDEQNKDFQEWAFNAVNDILMNAYSSEPNGMKVVWSVKNRISGGKDPLYVHYITKSIVPKDMRWLLFAFVFVFAFLAYQSQSLFLSCVALGMIVLNVVPTATLYVLLCRQTYFGILQILSLFLIMGIGVDDVFVLLECYRQHRESDRHLAKDLPVAWQHAAKAMLCTSATTFFSFVTNTTSSFPAVYTFGFWCCCLIVTNYVAVNTIFLAAVGVYDKHLKGKTWCWNGQSLKTKCLPVFFKQSAQTRFDMAQFLEHRFFDFIKWARVPLVLLWVALFVAYGVCAYHLKPDPEAPKLLPASDPYMQWSETFVKHFGAFEDPRLVTTKLVFGIDRDSPLNREGTDPADVSDRGTVNWSGLSASDLEWRQAQVWLTDLCADMEARAGVVADSLKISTDGMAVKCPWAHLSNWVVQQGHEWPIPTYQELEANVSMFIRSPNLQNPQDSNYDRWSGNMFFASSKNETFGVEPKFFTIDVKLTVAADTLFEDGIDLWQAWEDYCEHWRASAPPFLQRGFFFTDIRNGDGAFHWFFLQSKITKEAIVGMSLALGFACIVLLVATRNMVVATCAILCVCSIVVSVVAFMFCVGWKLGVLEALVLVMVIGLSVDYVVHMADSYLEAPAQDRTGRTQYMMKKMGLAVLNGAATTIGAAAFMCMTYITFFQKFGIVILVTVFQSLITSLFFFSALMAVVGPQDTCGHICIPSMSELCKSSKVLSVRCRPCASACAEEP